MTILVAFIVGTFSVLLFSLAWFERAAGNERDAKTLGICGTGATLATAVIAFLD
jgi:hypothetical protein